MSYNVNFDTVANSISNLTVTGIQILDLTEIPVNGSLVCPCIFPRPDNYITDFSVTNDSQGTGTGKQVTIRYTLHYIFLQAPVGADLSFGFYNTMVSNVAAIISKLIESDKIAGCVDLVIDTIPTFSPVNDPAGNVYHGCELALKITQFGEVNG